MYNPETMAYLKAIKILAIDWGSKRIGLAISDPYGKLARPLSVFYHTSREEDAREIAKIAQENSVAAVIMGITYDDENQLTPSGRSAKRLADAVSETIGKPVILWDEAFTTRDAKRLQIAKGTARLKRGGHQDSLSAALLLQDYLEKTNP